MFPDGTLADKEAFYSQLAWLDVTSDGQDEIAQEDRALRNKNRAFFQRALSEDTATTIAHESPTRVPRRSSTAPTPISAQPAVTIIKATPGGAASSKQANGQRLQANTSFVQDTPFQEPQPSAVDRLRRSATNPSSLPSSAKSFPSQQNSGSAMGSRKRKHDAAAPLPRQILRDLRFFYIPGDRKNRVRMQRMELAERYGAVIISVLADATHVIVDDGLSFEHIKDTVAFVIDQEQPSIVREHWPLDSIEEKRLLPTTSAWYRVVPPTKTTGSSPPVASAAEEPAQEPLEIKAARHGPKRQGHNPHHNPSQSEKSSAPQYGNHSETGMGANAAHVTIPSSQPSSGDGPSRAGPTVNHPAGHGYGDRLSQLIQDVQMKYRDLPSIEGDDENKEDSDDTSQNESRRKRRANRIKKSQASKPRLEDSFACSRGGTIEKSGGPNGRTIQVLRQMLDYYTRTNDHYRVMAYRKGINTLSRQPEKVTTAEEAILLPCVGPNLSRKIEEIVRTDRLQRLEYAQGDPTSKTLQLFLGIYGVGLSTANQWIAKGFRTLNDLRRHAELTPNQRVGIDHYEDLNTRIPRAEVEALGSYVKDEAACIDKKVGLIIGGSYRRGADSSGDIDFIITKAGTKSSEELAPFLDVLVNNLTEKGFLTAQLAAHSARSSKDDSGSKWHGCCVLPRVADSVGGRPWRRIDFLLVPETEYGAALIYFTGDDIFNRSVRLLAGMKDMRLNQRGLYREVIRGYNRQRLNEGELVEGKSEKRIFEILGVQWREPHERWC